MWTIILASSSLTSTYPWLTWKIKPNRKFAQTEASTLFTLNGMAYILATLSSNVNIQVVGRMSSGSTLFWVALCFSSSRNPLIAK